jgi:fructose-1,6-bisphosphatase/inositol monophosphatase family enzyme
MNTVSADEIAAIITKVAQETTMPYFGNLTGGDVSEKSPGDWLTIADIETEAALTDRLTRYLPGSTVVGEETAEAHPEIIQLLKKDGDVWVIDPIDGTTGFKNGEPTFVTMVALQRDQKTVLGIIHHPVSGDTLVVEHGKGVWLHRDGAKIAMKLAAHNPSVNTVQLGVKGAVNGIAGFTAYNANYYPTGGVYGGMFVGGNGETFAGNTATRAATTVHTHTKPWDHFAGKLMVEELGGSVTDLFGRHYNGLNRSGLLVTSIQDGYAHRSSSLQKVVDRTLPLALSLDVLTDGKIPYTTFSEFISKEGTEKAKLMAENFLGFKIKDSRLQPLFESNGQPMRDEGGKQICLPWTWPACLSRELIKRAGRESDLSGHNLSDLPLPFWLAVDVYLISADGYSIAATRSNATPSGIGKTFNLAAGFSDVRDGSVLATAVREMREETDLTLAALKLEMGRGMIELPLVTQRLANTYNENMAPVGGAENIQQSCCPSIGRTIALQSRLTAKEILRLIRLNEESVGVAAIPLEGLLEQLRHPSTKIGVLYAASEWRPRDMSYGYSNTLERPRAVLTKLRREPNSRSTRPPRDKKHRLGQPKTIIFSAPSDMMWNESQEALSRTIQVAQEFRLIKESVHVLSRRRWRLNHLSMR